MARRKITPFRPWETCKPDGIEKRFERLGDTQLLHPVLLKLPPRAFKLYVYMRIEAGDKKQFTFPKSKAIKIFSYNTFQVAKDELIENGLIKEIQNNKNLRKPNIYEFSEDWKNHSPP